MNKQEVFERLNKIKIDLSNAAGASSSSAAEHVRAVVAPVHDLVKLIEDMVVPDPVIAVEEGYEDVVRRQLQTKSLEKFRQPLQVSATAPREELTEPNTEPTVVIPHPELVPKPIEMTQVGYTDLTPSDDLVRHDPPEPNTLGLSPYYTKETTSAPAAAGATELKVKLEGSAAMASTDLPKGLGPQFVEPDVATQLENAGPAPLEPVPAEEGEAK